MSRSIPSQVSCPFCDKPTPHDGYDVELARQHPAMAREIRAWWRQHLAGCVSLQDPRRIGL